MISTLTIEACKEAYAPSVTENTTLFDTFLLKRMLYIYYLICFKKDQGKVQALLNSGNEVNAMIPAYATKLGFKVQSTDIRA